MRGFETARAYPCKRDALPTELSALASGSRAFRPFLPLVNAAFAEQTGYERKNSARGVPNYSRMNQKAPARLPANEGQTPPKELAMLKQPIPAERREHYSVRKAAANAVLAHELPYDLPPPPYGLPGENRDPDHAVMDMLQIGLEYLKAVANGEVRRQWNTYNEMNVEMSKLLRAGEAAQLDRIMEMDRRRDEERQAALIAESKRKGGARVYFLGSEDGPVKIGMAIDIGKRLKTLQTSHHCKLTLLAECGGGREQEQAYHKLFAPARLHGEWFTRCPEIESEIARLGGVA